MAMTETAAPKRSWRESLADYGDRRVAIMLGLGFSSGLPFPLIFATLSRWLSEAGVSLSAIGFFSLAGLAYGFKFAWAPLVDHVRLPLLDPWLGRRRAWILVAQIGVIAGIAGMAFTDPKSDLYTMALFAVVVGFSGATQDIAIDAWRIEIAPLPLQGALAGSYQLGYRIALFAGGAGVFFLVDALQGEGGAAEMTAGWRAGYLAMVAVMAIGIAATLLAGRPADPEKSRARRGDRRAWLLRAGDRVIEAVVNPFVDFFARTGWTGIAILVFIGCFWLSDRIWGVMAQPFYHQIGFDKTEVALVSKSYGILMSVAGALLGGAIISRFGVMRPLLAAAGLTALTNLLFAALAVHGKSVTFLILVISAENLAGGIAGTALIAYLSGLTNTAYTATQYALFSSLMALPGKLLASGSGVIVESVGYPLFFVYTTLMGIPAVALLLYLMSRQKELSPEPAARAAPEDRPAAAAIARRR